MARYKPYNLKQDKWIPLNCADQPGGVAMTAAAFANSHRVFLQAR
jgi:hypothetical protein